MGQLEEEGEREYKDRQQWGSKLGKAETWPLANPRFRLHLQDRIPSGKRGAASQCFFFLFFFPVVEA